MPTLRKQTESALDLLDLRPGQVLIDLGAGDGRVAIAAARRGLNVIGYELNPVLWLVARSRALPYGKQVKIRYGDFWRIRVPACDAVFVFGINRIMGKLESKLHKELQKDTKVISFTFQFPHEKPVEEREGLFLYRF